MATSGPAVRKRNSHPAESASVREFLSTTTGRVLGEMAVTRDRLTAAPGDVDSLDRRLDGDRQPTELRPLVERFNGMLDRLDRSYRQMAAFNADVAHELNTPLATLTTSNEVALRGELDRPADRSAQFQAVVPYDPEGGAAAIAAARSRAVRDLARQIASRGM